MKQAQNQNKVKIPNDIKYVRKVSSVVESFLKSKNIDDNSIFDIRLCLEEALKNSILHGNAGKKESYVFISYSVEDDKFIAEVEDEGEGFNPEKVPDPTADENILRGGGRGVFLIHKLMDKVEYNDRGNKVCMVKFIKERKAGNNAG